ncbi:hypothetical protein [Criblamydia sequanensis]|uniref:Uncharacterized protein n=1 Tax=Candidatus Criblamydia sequanensis CRIB-18 TaxID=1437425 RepID=A0A090D083_9BACT|nr:hypothetical protein [Criblamydia sequanensis]CDR34907.1 hypothetical protein CSEC_2101 [Criblamydia sequanensis CRIB-18]
MNTKTNDRAYLGRYLIEKSPDSFLTEGDFWVVSFFNLEARTTAAGLEIIEKKLI